MAIKFTGQDMWKALVDAHINILGHLHEIPLNRELMQGYFARGIVVAAGIVGPVVAACAVSGVLASAVQNRFQTSPEALSWNWERLNPIEGFKRTFSARSLVPTTSGIVKLGVIIGMTYSEVRRVLDDPVFMSAVDVARIAGFLAEAASRITMSIIMALMFLAGADYLYQVWRTTKDMMMTKEEVKDEMKENEGNPKMRAAMRKRRKGKTQRQILAEVPTADVVVTNPTHLAVALRYDRKKMRAPMIIAKGSRLNALRIREIATQNQIPIIENKPLARMMFKYGKVGGEIPAQLYAAVAEVLAYVYRVNRYRYYTEQNRN
jgi:flagellar biosynthetic protein FlhB